MDVLFDNIPNELKQRAQWVTWKYVNGTKVPFDARTGKTAKSNDPATWSTFDEARAAYQRRHHAGIGYVFSADDPYVGGDLDDCIRDDGTVAPIAWGILATINTYTEVSPSLKGAKFFMRATLADSLGQTPIGDGVTLELYPERRFFTMTGRRLEGTPAAIRSVNGELTTLYEQYKRKATRPSVEPTPLPNIKHDANHIERYVLGALQKARECMMAASEGHRHNTRRDEAYALAGYLWTGVIARQQIFDALDCNYGDNEEVAKKTIWDAIAKGEDAPREIPPPRHQTSTAQRVEPVIAEDLDTLDPETLRRRLREAIAERDQWKQRAQQLELELGHVQERNRFVTQAAGAEGIHTPSMRLTFIELKKELDRVPLEERAPDQFVQVRPAYMAACSNQNRSSISNHLAAFKDAGLIEKKVERTRDPETGEWYSATFVRPLVDLSDPSKVVIPAKPRGKQACNTCGSHKLVRETRVVCADCKTEQSFEQSFANDDEPESQNENQTGLDLDGAEEPVQETAESGAGLNCILQNREKDCSPAPVTSAGENQTRPPIADIQHDHPPASMPAPTARADYQRSTAPPKIVRPDLARRNVRKAAQR